jgi:vacuolar protein sorting-associated protein 54
VDVREHANREQSNEGNAVAAADLEAEGWGTQGEGLVACLREIPSLYFDEDFALEKGSTFQAACPFSSLPQNMLLQEKLSHYLDLVEVHLVKEISARSDSFFKALDQLEDLNSRIVGSCDQIHELQATVNVLSENLIEPARRVQSLEMRRHNLLALIEKLKFVEYVNQAIAAMRLVRCFFR